MLSILKLVSVESLAGNDFSERGTQAEAHCERNLNRQLWSIRRRISHRCLRNFQCSQTGCLTTLFAKNKPRKLVSPLVGCSLLFLKDLCTENRGKLPRKISRQRKNRDFSILNSRTSSQNNKTSRTSCRRLFGNVLPSTPTEVTFEISLNLARS